MARDIPPEVIADLKAAFAIYDKDGDGVVTTIEFASTLKGFGVSIAGTAFEDLIQRADQDHNGSIDFDEFVNMMTMNMHTQATTEEPLDPEEELLIKAFKEYD